MSFFLKIPCPVTGSLFRKLGEIAKRDGSFPAVTLRVPVILPSSYKVLSRLLTMQKEDRMCK
jgi:hypothetical protein